MPAGTWYRDLEAAQQAALQARLPILLQFEREHCAGCRKMEQVTYPLPEVQEELFGWFVPLKLDIFQHRRIRSALSAVWTPSFYVLDYREKQYLSLPGYLPPEDFRVWLRWARAAYLIPKGQYVLAIETLNDGIQRFPENPRIPTLLLWRGMAEYLSGWNKAQFYQTMEEIRRRFPRSAEARMWPWDEEEE